MLTQELVQRRKYSQAIVELIEVMRALCKLQVFNIGGICAHRSVLTLFWSQLRAQAISFWQNLSYAPPFKNRTTYIDSVDTRVDAGLCHSAENRFFGRLDE